MQYKFLFGLLPLLLLWGCYSREAAPGEFTDALALPYATDSDSARYYYARGWYEIMDLGDYAGAEVSYRKALEFDPDFLVGQSVLGRLTLDLDERLAIYDRVEAEKGTVSGDERRVLDVYQALVRYTNLRDQGDTAAAAALDTARQLALDNFGPVVRRYPEAGYLRAEFIEVVHSTYGAAAALDSLRRLPRTVLDRPRFIADDLPPGEAFLLGYAAELKAELGDFDAALADAERLAEHFGSQTVAKPHAVFAAIYYRMGDLAQAKTHADLAHQIDPRNLDASRLKEKIDAEIAAFAE
jgi:tetratricopeptide (TPR) repeat protein